MRLLHNNVAYLVAAANLLVGVWGLVMWRRKRSEPRAFWVTLGIAWSTVYVQGLLGLLLFERCQPPFRHHFYGFLFALITIIAFTQRGEEAGRRLFIFSALTFFIGVVSIRAIASGVPCGAP